MSDTGAFLYANFDSMFSAQFCGSKAADFCGSVSSNIFVLVSARDLTETLQGHDQIFRRMMTKLKLAASPLQSITFVVKAEAAESGNWESEIQDRLSEIWGDVSGDTQVSVRTWAFKQSDTHCDTFWGHDFFLFYLCI